MAKLDAARPHFKNFKHFKKKTFQISNISNISKIEAATTCTRSSSWFSYERMLSTKDDDTNTRRRD
jgi:hypothetical protein